MRRRGLVGLVMAIFCLSGAHGGCKNVTYENTIDVEQMNGLWYTPATDYSFWQGKQCQTTSRDHTETDGVLSETQEWKGGWMSLKGEFKKKNSGPFVYGMHVWGFDVLDVPTYVVYHNTDYSIVGLYYCKEVLGFTAVEGFDVHARSPSPLDPDVLAEIKNASNEAGYNPKGLYEVPVWDGCYGQ